MCSIENVCSTTKNKLIKRLLYHKSCFCERILIYARQWNCDRENGHIDWIPILFSPKFVCLLHSTISFFLFVSIPINQWMDGGKQIKTLLFTRIFLSQTNSLNISPAVSYLYYCNAHLANLSRHRIIMWRNWKFVN